MYWDGSSRSSTFFLKALMLSGLYETMYHNGAFEFPLEMSESQTNEVIDQVSLVKTYLKNFCYHV